MSITTKTLLAALLLSGAAVTTASAAETPPPAYTLVRWNEDYSYLKDPAARTDLFDPIKYIPLNSEGDWYLSLGGQARERYEFFNNNNFGAGPQDDNGYWLTRLMFHTDLHMGSNFRVFVQGKSALEDGRDGGPRPTDADQIDIQQAFADVRVPITDKNSFTLRSGRQDLLYGAQRLISPLDWTNVRRTFEGVKGSFVLGPQALDLFWVRPVIVHNESLNEGDGNSSFAGVYDTIALPHFLEKAGTKLELYGLALNQTPTATAVDLDTYTLGVRLSSVPKPWDFDVELDYQFGQSNGGSISAYSIATEGGFTFAQVPLMPRVYLGFDYASGDDDPADSDKQTFNQLFPLGHAYFGYVDAIGRQNIIDLHPGAELALLANKSWAKKLWLRGDYHLFWRASDSDAVYNAAGGVLRADNGSDETTIGSEVDLLLNWQISRHMFAYFGYSHFFAGDFIQQTGPSDDIDFFYTAFTYTF
jgi:hypothetical protein